VQRPKDGSDVTGVGSFDNSTCKRVLDLLEPGFLRLGYVAVKRVAVVKLRVKNGNGDDGSCFLYRGMDGYSKADECGNRKMWRQMVRNGVVFIEYEAEVSSRVHGCCVRSC